VLVGTDLHWTQGLHGVSDTFCARGRTRSSRTTKTIDCTSCARFVPLYPNRMPCYCPDAVFDCIVAASAAPYSATIYATYEFLFVRKGRRAPIKRYTYITPTPPGSQLDEALEVFADEMIDRGYTSDQVSEFADKLAPDLVSCLSQSVFFWWLHTNLARRCRRSRPQSHLRAGERTKKHLRGRKRSKRKKGKEAKELSTSMESSRAFDAPARDKRSEGSSANTTPPNRDTGVGA
jgi:hypothetical protein